MQRTVAERHDYNPYHARRHAANHAHVRIYINVAYSVYFRFPDSPIVGLELGLVVGLGSVLVLFFIAVSRFRCMLKEQV